MTRKYILYDARQISLWVERAAPEMLVVGHRCDPVRGYFVRVEDERGHEHDLYTVEDVMAALAAHYARQP